MIFRWKTRKHTIVSRLGDDTHPIGGIRVLSMLTRPVRIGAVFDRHDSNLAQFSLYAVNHHAVAAAPGAAQALQAELKRLTNPAQDLAQ
jgi:hypothetical protein